MEISEYPFTPGGQASDSMTTLTKTFCGSFMVFFLSCVCYAFVRVCLYVSCGHLLGKG